jgi:rRNA maturation endonuclease Nob1
MVNKSSLEKQIEKTYICKDCRRIMHFATHHKHCPYCGGTLVVTHFTIKGVGKSTSIDERGDVKRVKQL